MLVLAAVTPTGVVPFLEALPWSSSLPLFEHQGKPLVRALGPDGANVFSVVPLDEGVVLIVAATSLAVDLDLLVVFIGFELLLRDS